jgi:DNA-binding PadR family transcriptional regulator
MRGKGIHHALDIVEKEVLEEIQSNGGLFSFLEIIMRGRPKKWYQVTDKAWEAIHRCLAEGTFDYEHSMTSLQPTRQVTAAVTVGGHLPIRL